eukprot:3580775-Amphidinium_carterae.3
MNLQHKAHMAIKFIGSKSDSEDKEEEPATKRIKPNETDNVQQGTIMHFNKGSTVTININQETISNKPSYKLVDIKDSKIGGNKSSPN